MPFLSLSVYNFRNLQNESIDLRNKEVYFVGENGQGKSNLLEALYYAAYGSSFRTKSDTEIIRHGEHEYSVRAMYQEETGTKRMIHVYSKNGKKTIEKNGKKIQDRKELINTMPCVVFCHDDLQFAVGEPECRRFFLDQSLSMYDVLYIDVLRKYKHILKSRNLVLKQHNYDMLDIYDTQLVENGLLIQKKRKDLVFQFNQIFGNLYKEVSGIENITIAYEPSWKETKNSDEIVSSFPTTDEVLQHLREKQEQDKIMETTLSGPHRDRVIFKKDGKPFVPSASTGQRRLLVLLLRIGQALFFTQVTGVKPVLLMDDVMLELDPEKRMRLTSFLPEYDQLFCTFLPGEPYEKYKKSQTKVFFIDKGKWHE